MQLMRYKYQRKALNRATVRYKGDEFEITEYPNDVFVVHRLGTKLFHEVIRVSKRKFTCDCQWHRMGLGECRHIGAVKEYLLNKKR